MAKKKPTKKKVAKAPTVMQRKALKIAMENNGNLSKAMKEAGYAPSTSKNPHLLKESDGWQQLLKEAGLDDKSLMKSHRELLDQKRVDYFVFPRSMDDEEIKGHVEAAGLRVITVRSSDKGKMAFYSVPDAQAKKNALEMAYKLRGAFGNTGEGGVVAVQINNLLGSKKEEYGI